MSRWAARLGRSRTASSARPRHLGVRLQGRAQDAGLRGATGRRRSARRTRRVALSRLQTGTISSSTCRPSPMLAIPPRLDAAGNGGGRLVRDIGRPPRDAARAGGRGFPSSGASPSAGWSCSRSLRSASSTRKSSCSARSMSSSRSSPLPRSWRCDAGREVAAGAARRSRDRRSSHTPCSSSHGSSRRRRAAVGRCSARVGRRGRCSSCPPRSTAWEGNAALHREWWRTVSETTAPNLSNCTTTCRSRRCTSSWIGPGTPVGARSRLARAVLLLGIVALVFIGRRGTPVPRRDRGRDAPDADAAPLPAGLALRFSDRNTGDRVSRELRGPSAPSAACRSRSRRSRRSASACST